MRHLLLGVVCALAITPQTSPIHARQRPNVVLLIIDDVRWDSIRAAGNKIVHTPRLDQLAKEGVRFGQARVTTVDLHGEPCVALDRSVHVAAPDHGVWPGAHA